MSAPEPRLQFDTALAKPVGAPVGFVPARRRWSRERKIALVLSAMLGLALLAMPGGVYLA